MPATDLFPASAQLDWRESLATCHSQLQLLNLPDDSPVMTGPRFLLLEGGSAAPVLSSCTEQVVERAPRAK